MKLQSIHVFLTVTVMVLPAWATEPTGIFPGTDYNSEIPTLEKIVGFDFGQDITMHHEVIAYAQALAAASPRVSLQIRGKTWEGRQMGLLIVTSEENQAKLAELRADYLALANPQDTEPEKLNRLLSTLPVQVLLQESVHGNEISGTDSGLFLAWHLAAAVNDTNIENILQNAVLTIELMQNPDGRDRFVTYSRQHRAPGGDADPQSAEQTEPWPSGRFNHYLFDMNRDWFAMTQLETQAKVASYLQWFPQVVVDLHEMGSESSFFAAKPSPPANPFLPQTMLDQYEKFGKAIGRTFDERGIDYFHSEIFDSFYPGYGEAWPSLHGSMGVLFEQASAGGLQYKRRDGSILTYGESVAHQAIASYAVLQHAVTNRREVLEFFYNNRNDPISEAKEDRQVFLLPGKDPHRAVSLGRLLQRQGIEVAQLTKPLRGQSIKDFFKAPFRKTEIPESTVVVRLDQPAGRLAKSLLTAQIDMDEAFREEQEKLLAQRKSPHIYDITAWSLPLLFGVETAYGSGSSIKELVTEELKVPYGVYEPEAKLGYLIPYNLETGPVLAALLNKGIRVSYTTKPIKYRDHELPAGSLIVRRKDNPEDLPKTLANLAEKHEVSLIGTNTSWFESGPSFGSGSVRTVIAPRIALLWNAPTNPMSAGWMRFILEQQFKYPVTAINTENVRRFDLSKYNVLVIPSASASGLERELTAAGTESIKRWVAEGGVLVGFGRATEWLISSEVALLSTAKELRGGELADKDAEQHPKKPVADPREMILPRQEPPDAAYGALLRVDFEKDHWLTFGMPESQAVLVDSNRIFRPLRLDDGLNPGRFAAKDELRIAGFVAEEVLAQFAHKPFLMVRSHQLGLVVAFTEDPNYRAFTKGMLPLVANAIFFGPSQSDR